MHANNNVKNRSSSIDSVLNAELGTLATIVTVAVS